MLEAIHLQTMNLWPNAPIEATNVIRMNTSYQFFKFLDVCTVSILEETHPVVSIHFLFETIQESGQTYTGDVSIFKQILICWTFSVTVAPTLAYITKIMLNFILFRSRGVHNCK